MLVRLETRSPAPAPVERTIEPAPAAPGHAILHPVDVRHEPPPQPMPCTASATDPAEPVVLRFARRQIILADEQRLSLLRLATQARACANAKVQIRSFTDSQGGSAANERISTLRAWLVAEFLAANGIASAAMDVAAFGAKNLLTTNDSNDGRNTNRRVEIHWTLQ